jgi:hypothetical protein
MEKASNKSNYKIGDMAPCYRAGGSCIRLAYTREYQEAPNRMATAMKLYLVFVTIAVFSFSALSGAVISSLPQMQFIKQQSAHLVMLSIRQLAEENI